MLLWTLTCALATDLQQEAWHHVTRQRYEEAASVAVQMLEADDRDLEAHRLYVQAQQRMDSRAGETLRPTYERWYVENPDDPIVRHAWLAVLYVATRGEDCDTALGLLGDLPEQPEDRYSALRIRQLWGRCDDFDADANDTALSKLGPESGAAGDSYKTWLAAKDSDWSAVGKQLPTLLATYPPRVSAVASMAFHPEPDKAAPGAVQDALLDWALTWKDTRDPIALDAMVTVLRRADHGQAKAASKKLDELDPPGGEPRPERSKLNDKVHEANQKPTHELALEALYALEPKLKRGTDDRAVWRWLVIRRLQAIGDTDRAYAILTEQAADQPELPYVVNDWAYESALRNENLEEAAAAMEAVFTDLDGRRPDGSLPYTDWVADIQSTQASYLDTHGWLLHKLDRNEEAAAVLTRASQFSDDTTVAAHTALVLRALGDDSGAWPYLVQAAAPDGTGEEALDREVREAIEALWPDHRQWHPGGLDGWLKDQHHKEAPDDTGGDDEGDGITQSHPLLGEALPFTEADLLGGGTLDLTDHDGILVVDLWATWCGPCVQGMPHLQEVADAYKDRGVRVVGLSVDQNAAAVKKFFADVDPEAIAYELGHVGAGGMDTAKVQGIPSLFVVGTDGTIATYISGYGPGDTRLEQALDKLLVER